MVGEHKVDDSQCYKKLRPVAKKECRLQDCPEWYPGGWGPVSHNPVFLLFFYCFCFFIDASSLRPLPLLLVLVHQDASNQSLNID